jgi:hypothetical protein
MLSITLLIDVFAVHACVDEAAGTAGRIPPAVAPGRPARTEERARELFAQGRGIKAIKLIRKRWRWASRRP